MYDNNFAVIVFLTAGEEEENQTRNQDPREFTKRNEYHQSAIHRQRPSGNYYVIDALEKRQNAYCNGAGAVCLSNETIVRGSNLSCMSPSHIKLFSDTRN